MQYILDCAQYLRWQMMEFRGPNNLSEQKHQDCSCKRKEDFQGLHISTNRARYDRQSYTLLGPIRSKRGKSKTNMSHVLEETQSNWKWKRLNSFLNYAGLWTRYAQLTMNTTDTFPYQPQCERCKTRPGNNRLAIQLKKTATLLYLERGGGISHPSGVEQSAWDVCVPQI